MSKQREILFRAWTGTEMVILENTGLQYYDFEGSYSLGFTVDAYTDFWAHEQYTQASIKANKCPIMQFTGLFDRNGVRIFEHDLLKFGESIYIIRWDSQKALFGIFFPDNERLASYPFTDSDRYEVVGNIHQNPELL